MPGAPALSLSSAALSPQALLPSSPPFILRGPHVHPQVLRPALPTPQAPSSPLWSLPPSLHPTSLPLQTILSSLPSLPPADVGLPSALCRGYSRDIPSFPPHPNLVPTPQMAEAVSTPLVMGAPLPSEQGMVLNWQTQLLPSAWVPAKPGTWRCQHLPPSRARRSPACVRVG